MTVLKREVEKLKIIISDLKDQVRRMDQEHEERMDHHREDIDWQREECILLRAGLQCQGNPCTLQLQTSPRTSVLGRGSDRQSAGSVDRKT